MASFYDKVDLTNVLVDVGGSNRTADGSGNNVNGGGANDIYDRYHHTTVTNYGSIDGLSWDAPTATSPADISDNIMAIDGDHPNSFGINELFQFFGQFATHDVARGQFGGTGGQDAEVVAGVGRIGNFTRDFFTTDENGIRAAVNTQTAFFDLSQIYGQNQDKLDLLRLDGSAKLIVGFDNLLPNSVDIVNPDNNFDISRIHEAFDDVQGVGTVFDGTDATGFVAGDFRVNQQAQLSSLQTLFVRNHNWHVDQIEAQHSDWSIDRVFDTARAISEAEWQHIVYDEYVAKLVGEDALSKYSGFKSGVDPSIINEWTTVAFRFGHDQASNESPKQLEDGTVTAIVDLGDNFFAGIVGQTLSSSDDMDQWMRGQMTQATQEIDGKVSNAVRTNLFGFGLDLAVLDIARGDDHGVGNYNILRGELGLDKYTSITQYASDNNIDAATTQALIDIYGVGTDSQEAMDKVDSEVGGLLEKHAKGSMLGETYTILNVEQFENTRDGDAFWYENRFNGDTALINAIHNTSLSDIIARNTGIDYIYHDAFIAAARIGGGDQADIINGTVKGDLVLGFDSADGLHGRGGSDDVWGGDGNDRLFGEGGDDFLFGEAGDDKNMKGGSGKDNLNGGAGIDYMWGGTNADIFAFDTDNQSIDRIRDFSSVDKIDLSELSGFTKFNDVRTHMTNSGGNVVLDLDGSGSVIIENTTTSSLAAGDFIYTEIFI